MSEHLDALLGDLVVGVLDVEQARAAEQHLAACARCGEELAALEEASSMLSVELDPVQPLGELRDRILQSTRVERRFSHFDDRLAEHFDIPIEEARDLLDRIDRPEAWGVGPLPGIQMIMVRIGPAHPACVGALMKVAPGTQFPWHRHTGDEASLMLQGSCIDSNGTVYRAGHLTQYGPDTAHDFVVEDDASYFVFASRSGGMQVEPRPSH